MTEKDLEQDAMIRQNADHIRRNEEAIRRQTECLEKIRDHYFPHKNFWKRGCGFVLKIIGAMTVGAGLMETFDWYWNARQIECLAEQSVVVARRLLFEENDVQGAMDFLNKAVELENGKAKYRLLLAYLKGLATVVDLVDIGRPLAEDERARVDAILSEAVFLQTADPKHPMPHVVAAYAYLLRGRNDLCRASIAKAVEIGPDNVIVRCAACAMAFFTHDLAALRVQVARANEIDPNFLMVPYWRGMLAMADGHDYARAQAQFRDMIRVSPWKALPHAMLGLAMYLEGKSDLPAVRSEFLKALEVNPRLKQAAWRVGETYEAEGNLQLARIWYDRALNEDARFMKALRSRARVEGKLGDWKASVEDLSAAIRLDALAADLYRERADAHEKGGVGARPPLTAPRRQRSDRSVEGR